MKVINCIQGSAEWFDARCGRITASRVSDVLAFLKKGGESAARRNMRMQLAAEILTEKITENFTSPAMEWGVITEPVARTAYEIETGNDVKLVGFVVHPKIERAGASPDGLVGKDGLIEIKCPNTVTHLDYLLGGVIPSDYQPQMLWQLACTEREWCDFVSFDPRLPERYQLFVKRMVRDEQRIKEMESAVMDFLMEVDEVIAKLPKGESVLA